MLTPPPTHVFRIDHRIAGSLGCDLTSDWDQAEAILDCLENIDAEKRLTIYRRVDDPKGEREEFAEEWAGFPPERVNEMWEASIAGGVALIAICILVFFI